MMEQPPPPPKPDSESDNKSPEAKPGSDHAPNGVGVASEAPGGDHNTESSPEHPNRTLSARKSVHWSPDLVTESRSSSANNSTDTYHYNINNNNNSDGNSYYRDGSNPYISSSTAPTSSSSFNFKETMGTVKDVLGRWGKKVGEATKKAEDLAGNTWQHREWFF